MSTMPVSFQTLCGINLERVRSDEEHVTAQLAHDHEIASAWQKRIDNDDYVEIVPASVVKPVPTPTKCSTITDPASAVKKSEKLVNQDLPLLLTVRCGISLNGVVQFWQRERKRKPSKVVIKHWGEQGIDTGALAREFFTDVISDIAELMFPNGSPVSLHQEWKFQGSWRNCSSNSCTKRTCTLLVVRWR